jgi:ATP-dependent DNA helicase RecG
MTSVKDLDFLTPKEKLFLEKSKIQTFEELIYYFPYKYLEAPIEKTIESVTLGENVSVNGIISDIQVKKGFYNGLKFCRARIKDDSDEIDAFWWNMPFVAKNLSVGDKITLTGIVSDFQGRKILTNPKFEKKKEFIIQTSGSLFEKEKDEPLTGIYNENKNFKSFQIRRVILKALKSKYFELTENLLPDDLMKKLNLPNRKSAILRKHLPRDQKDVDAANKFFAFEEIFILQLYRAYERILRFDEHAYQIQKPKDWENVLKETLPYTLTNGQHNVLENILSDMERDKPMSRLVEGDVGSGKTAIAFACAVLTILNKSKTTKKPLQVALIAPTEILAEQHFNFFISCLKEYDYFGVALLTSRGAKIWPSKTEKNKVAEVPKTRIKRLLENGQVHIVIGTHALFNKNVLFENLGLIILDEQHRFGVKQRKALIENNKENKVVKAKNDLREIQSDRPIPHLLSMSATPIPRTLALTIYGDLDLSILSELPPGRKRATTKVVDKYKREEMYETFVNEIKKGRQGYIIAPRITHDENTSTKSSVEYEEKRIKEKYPKLKIGVLHGKDKNKDETIQKFYKHELDILISTTVIEVGVSVPNATVMIIENAETFGLAQLHQLRGRVERSSNESFCFLASDSLQENSLKRLSALEKTSNGFDLAEVDLLERGAGSLIGNRQSGLTDVGMEAIKNRKLVETAKHEAENLIGLDPELLNHPKLKNALEIFSFHNE